MLTQVGARLEVLIRGRARGTLRFQVHLSYAIPSPFKCAAGAPHLKNKIQTHLTGSECTSQWCDAMRNPCLEFRSKNCRSSFLPNTEVPFENPNNSKKFPLQHAVSTRSFH